MTAVFRYLGSVLRVYTRWVNNTPVVDPSSLHLFHPAPDSRKGDNGRLLVIGGSKLFHSSIFWAADVASRVVDLVHFTSPANENNELVRKKLKEGFWSGIVVEWGDVEHYIEEDDAILIGPGMVRGSDANDANTHSNDTNNSLHSHAFVDSHRVHQLDRWAESDETREIVNYLLRKYPSKRWVIDGGALQEVDPELIQSSMIITPNLKEFYLLNKKIGLSISSKTSFPSPEHVTKLSEALHECTVVLKGPTDAICRGSQCVLNNTGNEGMTKGGTGDVLAGLIAALYTKNDAWTAAAAGAYVNGVAGDRLKERVGVYYNAGDLVREIPLVLSELT